MHSDLKVLDPIWTTRQHRAQPRLHGVGHAVRDGREAAAAAPDGRHVEPERRQAHLRFTLRDGLKWHDGKPVTAEDCIASLKRWGARDSTGVKLLSFVSSLEPVNDKTVQDRAEGALRPRHRFAGQARRLDAR